MTDTSATTILIVDDNKFSRELLSERLEPEGYRLETAASGREALVKAAELLPDLVLLDVVMPEMDGFEVCRRLRANAALREIPILMITALEDHESRVRGLEVGADDFVSKTYDPTELRARIRTIARLDRYRRLHQERQKLEWVVETSEDGYLLLGPDDQITYANARAWSYLGKAQPSSGQHEGGDFLTEVSRQFRCEPEGRWARWPRIGPSPLFLLRPQGRTVGALWLRVEMLELPIDDPSNRLVRLSNQSLQMSLGRNLWKFGALVSQKLHTPLNIVLGSLEMISQNTDRYSHEEIASLAELALRSGQRMQTKVADLISLLDRSDLTELDEGFGLVDLESLVDVLAQLLELGKVAVATSGDWQGVRVQLSPASFELMLREILDNLRRIGATDLVVEAQCTSTERATVCISSQCTSVTAEQLELHWVPFYSATPQRDSLAELTETEDQQRSRGMGVSMVGSLIWGIGGRFEIRQTDQSGLEVEIELPCGVATDSQAQSQMPF